ncbi:Trafficking kinesin-binding protein 1, partial [Exaiptasia diaphana]
LSSDRTNQMTKTHNDLDAILQLLQEKEKDLELAARIGQSLLERNKNLMHKTEVMEKYLGEHTDREEQLRHDIVRKNELLQKFLNDQEDMFLEGDYRSEEGSKGSDTPCIGRDDSFNTLQNKCQLLEQQNTRFILEALQIKEQTASEEQKERQLVADCVEQLIEAKDQISNLTDDIARKAEDNV